MIAELISQSVPCPVGLPRSKGVHVSSVIRCIATETGILKPEWADELSLVDTSQQDWWDGLDEVARLRVSIGLAWEQWYLPNLGHVSHQPGEMQVDGIYMTHDGESIESILTERGRHPALCLHEVKATYKSTKTVANLEDQWMWLAQTKAYCKGLGTRIAYLHVLFLCGDYKFPISPLLKVWRIIYEQAEIDEGWDLLIGYVRENQHLLEDYGQGG